MFGAGLLKGLGVTLKHAMDTYIDDSKKVPSRYDQSIVHNSNSRVMIQPQDQEGLFTIQYPEERRLLPERFRYIPMLIWDTEKGEDRCTACGICAKVCPPQCIWIVRDSDENGRPVARPRDFFIDATVCMSCNFCVEFCPFDAIKMNHDYELAAFERYPHLVYDKAELTVPMEYYGALWPKQFAEEQEQRRKDDEEARAKEEAKAKRAAAKASAEASAKSDTETKGAAKPQRSPAEVAEMKRKAQERAAQAKAKASHGESSEAASGDDAAQRREELKRKAQERASQRQAGKSDE